MKDVVGKILEHPIASIAIILASGKAVATVIDGIRGVKQDPIIKIDLKRKEEEK